jgi:hypothetical protein
MVGGHVMGPYHGTVSIPGNSHWQLMLTKRTAAGAEEKSSYWGFPHLYLSQYTTEAMLFT